METEGPYPSKPPFDPPRWHDRGGRWGKARQGWYAFYATTGPGSSVWYVEHPTDPNWWHPEPGSKAANDYHGSWACRHGRLQEQGCEICGSGPGTLPTEEEVMAAGLATLRLVKRIEGTEEDDMAESPAYKSVPARIIEAVMERQREAVEQGRCGLTLSAQIVDALVEGGFMDKPPQPEHNHFTRDMRPETCPACEATVTKQALDAYAKHCRSSDQTEQSTER